MWPLVFPQSPHRLSLPSSGNEAKVQSPAFLCWHGCYLRGGMILCINLRMSKRFSNVLYPQQKIHNKTVDCNVAWENYTSENSVET